MHNHGYSRKYGSCEKTLRESISAWYQQRFQVSLDPKKNVLPLIGSKEGISNLTRAFLNPKDLAIVPSPCYPIHFNSVLLSGARVYDLALTKNNHYRPVLDKIPQKVLDEAKMIFLNYPHNPTTAIVDLEFYKKFVHFFENKNIIIVSDLAYSEIVYNPQKKPPSLLQVKNALSKNIIEFHTLSKTYNMAGWRIAFAVGNAEILSILEKIKMYSDFGIFRPIQYAAKEALSGDQHTVRETIKKYRSRIDFFVNELNAMGWSVDQPEATFYLWAKLPSQYKHLSSLEFVAFFLEKTGIALSPGSGFGKYGEHHVRFSMIQNLSRLEEAVRRMRTFFS